MNINIFTKICAGDIGHDRMKLKDNIGWVVGGVKCSLMYNYTSIVGEGSKDNTRQLKLKTKGCQKFHQLASKNNKQTIG